MKQSKNTLLKIILVLIVLSLGFTACNGKQSNLPGDETQGPATREQTTQNQTPEPEQKPTTDLRGKTQIVLGGDLPDDPVPTWTQAAIQTKTALANQEPTSTPPGILVQFDQFYKVYQGGFSLETDSDVHVSVRGPIALIGSRSNPINALVIGNVSNYEMVEIEELPTTVFANIFGSDAKINDEEAEPIELDGVEGIALNYVTQVNQMIAKGRMVVVKPSEKRYLAVIGVGDPADPEGDQWLTYGIEFFEKILNGVKVLGDEELETRTVCPMAEDESYGYSPDNPIRVGGDAFDGPARARAYLENLQDSNRKWLAYEREGSMEHGGTILDAYKVLLGEEVVTIYVDQYSYEELLTPIGFNCAGAYPLIAP